MSLCRVGCGESAGPGSVRWQWYQSIMVESSVMMMLSVLW